MNNDLRRIVFYAMVLVSVGAPCAHAVSVSPTGSLSAARFDASTAMMSDGRVMVAGGIGLPSDSASIEIYDPATGEFSGGPFVSMTEPRARAMSVALPNGKILIAGGFESFGSSSSLRSAELFDPTTRQSSSTGIMTTRRQGATATLLADGRVLIAGGFDGGDGGGLGGDPGVGGLASAEIFDPLDNTFTPTGSMSSFREGASAVLLVTGQVLIIGGSDRQNGVFVNTSEIFEPASGQFGSVATIPGGGRTNAIAVSLADGRVLIAGGVGGSPNTPAYLSSALLYSFGPNSHQFTGSMTNARSEAGAALLPSNKVLVVGGQNGRFSATAGIESYDTATGMFSQEGALATARASASVAVLPDGRILVAGGNVPPPNQNLGGTTLSSAELIAQPVRTTASTSNAMSVARAGAVVSPLLNGRILIAGGRNGTQLTTHADVYNESSGTFAGVGALATAREGAISALLPDGSVIVIGGIDANGTPLASAERFNPQTQSFSTNPRPLWKARQLAGSALLPNGHLLVVGGRDANGALASAETFDGRTGMFRTTGALTTARSESSTVLLANGLVLVAGGQNASPGTLSSAEFYDPATRLFSPIASTLATARRAAMTALLPNGKVLIVGGRNAASTPLASAELFDPSTQTFSPTASLASARTDAAIIVLPNGKVMVAGGLNAAGMSLATSEIYDPGARTFSAGPALAAARARSVVALTPLGRVLLAGGSSMPNTSLASAETHLLSAFGNVASNQRPRFTVTPSALELPGAFGLSGEGLRGSTRLPVFVEGEGAGSEGSNGGGGSVPTNAPLLRLQRIDNQQVIYQSPDPGLPWTDFDFFAPILGRFDPNDPINTRMAGAYRVVIGVNGIQSSARNLSLYWIEDELFASGFQPNE